MAKRVAKLYCISNKFVYIKVSHWCDTWINKRLIKEVWPCFHVWLKGWKDRRLLWWLGVAEGPIQL